MKERNKAPFMFFRIELMIKIMSVKEVPAPKTKPKQ